MTIHQILQIVSMILFYAGACLVSAAFVKVARQRKRAMLLHNWTRYSLYGFPALVTVWAIGTYINLSAITGSFFAVIILVPCYAAWALYYVAGMMRAFRQ